MIQKGGVYIAFNHKEGIRLQMYLKSCRGTARKCTGCKLAPSKIQIGEGRFLCISIQKPQIGGRQSLFGGCQFTFWGLKLSWGCFIEKG